MTLKRIRLELARNKDYPDGSAEHGYEFRAPLRPDGQIDLEKWERQAQLCTVHHFWGTQLDERGQLIRMANGKWAFSYVVGDDDEPIFASIRTSSPSANTSPSPSTTVRIAHSRSWRSTICHCQVRHEEC